MKQQTCTKYFLEAKVFYYVPFVCVPMCGFIAQLVDYRTGIAEVTIYTLCVLLTANTQVKEALLVFDKDIR